MLEIQLRTRFMWCLRGGGLRPVVVVALLAAVFVAFPDRNLSLRGADAASSSPSCASSAGYGGLTTDETAAQAGHGCVVIQYGSTYVSYNYFGSDFSWVVPADVTSVIFHALGAGGGGGRTSTFYGGGGGYATGTYAVTPGQTYSVIVGQGGSRPTTTSLSGCHYTPLTLVLHSVLSAGSRVRADHGLQLSSPNCSAQRC